MVNGDATWTKKRIEPMETEDADPASQEKDSLTPNANTSTPSGQIQHNTVAKQYSVAEYDALINVPKSADEAILMGTNYGSGSGTGSGTGSETNPTPPVYPTNLNLNMAAQQWKSGVESGPDVIDSAMNAAALAIVSLCYAGDTTSEEPQRATKIIKNQLYRLIGLFLSFIIIWNWWYLWNYTSFSYDFEILLDYPPFSILFYIFEPSFKVIELLNYYLITVRLDSGISIKGREIMRILWDYRPITFGLFTFLILGGCLNIPFGAVFVSIFSGNATGITQIVILMSILMYIYLTVNPNRIRSFMVYFFWFPPIIIFVILLLLLLVYIVSRFTAAIFATYLLVLSHFTLLMFTKFSPLTAIWKIYDDLSTAPVSDAKTEDSVKKLGQLLFRNAHTLMMNSLLITLFSFNMVEVATLKNPAAIMFIVFVINLVFIAAFLPALKLGYTVIKSIFDALMHNSWTGESNEKGVELPQAFP